MNPKTPPVTNINLKLLQTFVLVAEHGSFHRAADQSYRSQSAVSSQIRQLEQQLGFLLFHRTTRRVRLTSDGAQLLPHAARALEEVNIGLQRVLGGTTGPYESVTFASLPTIAAQYMPGLFITFRRQYPHCGVYVRELDAVDLFESVRQGEVDFALAADNRGKEFCFDPLFEDRYVALVPVKFVTGEQTSIGLAQLAAQSLFLLNPRGKISRTLTFALQDANIEVRTHCQFRQIRTVLSMVEAGLGVTILPESALPAKLPGSVKQLDICEPEVRRQICVVRFRGRRLTASAAKMVDLIRHQFDWAHRATPEALSEISPFPPLVAVGQKGGRNCPAPRIRSREPPRDASDPGLGVPASHRPLPGA